MKKNTLFALIISAASILLSCEKEIEEDKKLELQANITSFTRLSIDHDDNDASEPISFDWSQGDSFRIPTSKETLVFKHKEDNTFICESAELLEGSQYSATYISPSEQNDSFDPSNYSFTQDGDDYDYIKDFASLSSTFVYKKGAPIEFSSTSALLEVKLSTDIAPKSLEFSDGTTTVNVDFVDADDDENYFYLTLLPTSTKSDLTISVIEEDGDKKTFTKLDVEAFTAGRLYFLDASLKTPENDIKLSVKPSDDRAVISTEVDQEIDHYFLMNLTSFDFDMNGGEENLHYLAQTFATRYINYGGDPTHVDNINVFSGDIDIEYINIFPSSEYVVLAFSASKEGKVISTISFERYTTLEYQEPDAELGSVKITDINHQDAKVTIDSGDYSEIYYSRLCGKEDFETFYGNDPVRAAFAFIENSIAKGHDLNTPDGRFIWKGDVTYQVGEIYPALLPSDDYFIFTFGIDARGTITTKIISSEFSTTEPLDPITDIEINITKITETSAYLEFIPDVNGLSYFASVFEKEYLDGLSDEQIIEKLENAEHFSGSIHVGPVSNTTDVLESNKEYIAVAFGYDEEEEEATSKVFTEIFKTEGGPSELEVPTEITLSATEFGEVVFDNVTSKSFDYNIHPADENIKYIVLGSLAGQGVYTDAQVAGKTDQELILEDLKVIAAAGEAGGMTFAQTIANEFVSRSGFWKNTYGPTVEGEKYHVLVYGIDITTAQPVTKLHRASFPSEPTELEVPTQITLSSTEFGEVIFDNVTSKSFDYNIHPDDDNIKYIVLGSLAGQGVYTDAQVAGKTDQELILEDLKVIAAAGEAGGMTFAQTIANEFVSRSGFWKNTYGPTAEGEKYHVLVYGIDITTAQPVTKLHRASFPSEPTELEVPTQITLSSTEFGEVIFDNVTSKSFDYNIHPDDDNIKYIVLGSLAGQGVYTDAQVAGKTDQELILEDLKVIAAAGEAGGMTFAQTIANEFVSRSGFWKNTYGPTVEGEKYHVLVYGIDITTAQPVTKLHRASFPSEPTELEVPTQITLSSTEFGEVIFDNVTSKSFDYNIHPDDDNIKYIVLGSLAGQGVYTDAQVAGKTDQELILEDLKVIAAAGEAGGMTFAQTIANEFVSRSGFWKNTYGPTVEGEKYHVLVYGIDITTAQPVTKLHRATYPTE